MQTVDFEFFLPPDRIAAAPADARDDARLLVMDRRGETRKHLRFRDILAELRPRSLLVLNDARVLAARLHGRKPTGGAVEFLLTQRVSIDAGDEGRQNTGFRELWEGLTRGLGGTAIPVRFPVSSPQDGPGNEVGGSTNQPEIPPTPWPLPPPTGSPSGGG